jgi:hypothetical protein
MNDLIKEWDAAGLVEHGGSLALAWTDPVELRLQFEATIPVDKVVEIAEAAGSKILEIYNSKVRRVLAM